MLTIFIPINFVSWFGLIIMHSLGDDWAFHSPSFCILLFDYISYLSLWSLTLPKSQRAGKRARKYLGLMFCSYNHNHFHFLQTNAGIFFVETLIPVPKKFNGNFILFSWKTFPKTNVSCFIKKTYTQQHILEPRIENYVVAIKHTCFAKA